MQVELRLAADELGHGLRMAPPATLRRLLQRLPAGQAVELVSRLPSAVGAVLWDRAITQDESGGAAREGGGGATSLSAMLTMTAEHAEAVEARASVAGVELLIRLAEQSGMGASTIRLLVAAAGDAVSRFWGEWTAGRLPVPAVPCRSQDLYAAYEHWAALQGVEEAVSETAFLQACAKRPGAGKARRRHHDPERAGMSAQSMILWPPGASRTAKIADLSRHVAEFRAALQGWKA